MSTFSPKKNLIKGINDVGKSHLIKSIFYALGAELKLDAEWVDANVKTIIEFSVGDKNFTLCRDGSLFSLFGSKDQLLLKTTSVSNDLAQKFSEIFDFHLYLAGQDGGSFLATPAFLFLPFYIDQDKGWGKSFDSFEKLQQFRGYRTPTIEYHTGIRPKEYYKLNIEKSQLNIEREVLLREISVLDSTWLDQRKKQKESGSMEVNINDFQNEVDALLKKINSLKENQQKYKWNLLKLNELKLAYEHQLNELREGVAERKIDLDFLIKAPSNIECPMCRTEFDNDFENRLEIAADIGDLKGYEGELVERYTELNRKIDLEKKKIEEIETISNEVESILIYKKKEIIFADYVKHEGRKEFIKELQSTINSKKEEQADREEKIKNISTVMKQYEDKQRTVSIKQDFFIQMKKSLSKLSVKMKEELYKDPVSNKIEKSGSDKPRALLAYYFSIISLIRSNSTTTFCPLVIDSPNQQDQDSENAKKMIKFIIEKCDDDDQLILGTVDTHGVEFEGNVIDLKNKYSLLSSEDYMKAVEKFDFYLARLD